MPNWKSYEATGMSRWSLLLQLYSHDNSSPPQRHCGCPPKPKTRLRRLVSNFFQEQSTLSVSFLPNFNRPPTIFLLFLFLILPAISKYYGDGSTYHQIWHGMNGIKRKAESLRKAVLMPLLLISRMMLALRKVFYILELKLFFLFFLFFNFALHAQWHFCGQFSPVFVLIFI